MNAVESFDCLIEQEFIALLHNFFDSIVEDFLNRFYGFNYIFVDLLALDVPREKLDDGIQLEDQPTDLFDIISWVLKFLDISFKVIQGFCYPIFNEIIHLKVDKLDIFLKFQLL
jgi:hypothetical protein